PKRCPEPSDKEFFDTFCKQIFSRELTVVEIKPDTGVIVSIKDLRLKECCIEEIRKINSAITSGRILSGVLVVLPLFQAFFYPPGYDKWASLASTVYSISSTDWELFAQDAMQIQIVARGYAFKYAHEHAWQHERKNDYKLKLFWEGIMHAFE
ncbi:MAG: hypothetical protein WAU91_23100, partial [Desulfatitalea sp.]